VTEHTVEPLIITETLVAFTSMSRGEETAGTSTPSSGTQSVVSATTVPDPIVVADTETEQVVEVNAAAGELFDCRPSELVGLDVSALHPGRTFEELLGRFRASIERRHVEKLPSGDPVEIETVDGRQKPVTVNLDHVERDGRSLIVGVFRDASDRLARERRLQSATGRLETLLATLPLPVAVLDTDGVVERWNDEAVETFGYAAADVIGERYPLFVDDEEFVELFGRLLDGEPVLGHETFHRGSDGSLFTVDLYAQPLTDGSEVTGVVGAAIDVTEREQHERQLSVLHRILRHNLRNRLTVVRGLAAEFTDGSGIGGDLDRTAAERIVAASDDLIQLSEQSKRLRSALRESDDSGGSVTVEALVETLAGTIEETATSATVRATVPESRAVVPRRAEDALGRLVAFVVDHVEEPTLTVSGRVPKPHVTVEISGDQALLPPGERAVVETGRETALNHGHGLDVVETALSLRSLGGRLSIPPDQPYASRLCVDLPRAETE
jgi:PAS domain S-box-containing protein